jgi:ribose 5-phosphate isomerase B
MIFISSDHGGWELKGKIIAWLKQKKLKFQDLGPKVLQQDDDYPDFAFSLAKKVVRAKENWGILICRSGLEMSIAANKVKKARAGLCSFLGQAITARAHNNCNILVLPADFIDEERALKIVKAFSQAEFSQEERNIRRLGKIEKYEKKK